MIKKQHTISINILSAFLIVLSLFVCVVGGTNSWFTQTHQNGVEIIVDLADMMLNLYQDNTDNLVYSLADNVNIDEKKYVSLSGEIVPDVDVDLNLILGNDNAGSVATFVKFKFELYARGVANPIPVTIKGFDAQSETAKGFILNEETGYYHYCGTDGKDCLLEANTTINLMTDFVVDYENLFDESGNLILNSSDSLYILLMVDASVNGWTAIGE